MSCFAHINWSRSAALLVTLAVTMSATAAAGTPDPRISRPEDFASAFASVPCDNKDRLAAVRALYESMGAQASDFRVDRFGEYGGVENLVIVKPGESQEKIVIGAHYDKRGDGCGAVDNWTGQVALAHLYGTLRNVSTRKTLVFVAFGREEENLVGSRAMVNAIPREQLAGYCGMVNVDSLGLARTQVADNMSSRSLEQLAADLARQMDMPFSHASLPRAYSDSNSFMSKGIPALTIHGLSNNWTQVLHQREDQGSLVKPLGVYLGYRLALSMIVSMDQAPCDAYR